MPFESWSDRKASRSQSSLFLSHAALPKSEGHPYYTKLNEVLACIDFDRQVEAKCGARKGSPKRGQHPFRVRSAGSGVERISDEGKTEVVLGWDMAGARGERQCSRRREECGSSAS